MENKNIVMLKHHFLNKVDVTTAVYTNQVEEHDLSDYVIVDATQRCKEWQELSPMMLGPIESFDGKVSKTFEEFYQCSKVYPAMDNNGLPNEYYYKWRNEHYEYDLTNHTAKELRHPQYNAHPNSPEEHYEHCDCLYVVYYENGKLKTSSDYVLTRKKVYITGYASIVTKTDAYKKLKKMVDEGRKIAILDFDAYNYYSKDVLKKEYQKYLKECKNAKITPKRCEEDYLNIKTIKDVINSPFMLAGHGFVLKALLQGDLEVMNGKIIDHSHILD